MSLWQMFLFLYNNPPRFLGEMEMELAKNLVETAKQNEVSHVGGK